MAGTSNAHQDQNDYFNTYDQCGRSYEWTSSFNMDSSQMDLTREQYFQSFNYTGQSDPNSSVTGFYSPIAQPNESWSNTPSSQVYSRHKFNLPKSPLDQPPLQSAIQPTSATGSAEFENEPPLLEELGINPDHILRKMLVVLNPLSETDDVFLQDVDMAGPLACVSAFAGLLLLSGKVHFSYIYGISVLGCLAMYTLLNLMTVSGVTVGLTVSVLGYCLFPMVALSGISALISLQGALGILLTTIAILWCSFSASSVFVSALNMQDQLLLVAYPCGLLYGIFALLALF